MKSRIIVSVLLVCLAFPYSVYAQEEVEKRSTKSNSGPLLLSLGGGAIIGGLLSLNNANRYEEKYDDPFRYDQTDVKENADNLRTFGYVAIGLGVVLGIFGINQMTAATATTVSVESSNGTNFLVAQHRY